MATLNDIHAAIATAVNGVGGLHATAWPEQGGTPPLAWPELDDWAPTVMKRRGTKVYQFTLKVFTSEATRPQDGYKALIELADSNEGTSIELAIWDANDQVAGAFGGLADTSAVVKAFTKLGRQEVDGREMYGGEFTLQVATRGA